MVVEEAQESATYNQGTTLFLDEIHWFNKAHKMRFCLVEEGLWSN